MSSDRSWAPLYRRVLTSDVWRGQQSSTKVVFVWIVLSIRHADGVTPAGSVDTSLERIAYETELSRRCVMNALKALVDVGFITATKHRNATRLTVIRHADWLRANQPADVTNESSRLAAIGRKVHDGSATVAPPSLLEEEEEDLLLRRSASTATESVASDSSFALVIPGDKVKPPASGYKETIAAFHDRYVAAYNSKPTWRVAEGAQLKKLLNVHGADEVQRRIELLFTHPPRWLSPPFTFMTLVKNFDALVVASGQQTTGHRRGGMSPEEIMQHASKMHSRMGDS